MQIFPNGTLRYPSSSASDLDENGMPMAASLSSMAECQCTITTNTENRNAVYNGGAYKAVTYSITCNTEDVEDDFNPKSVNLIHEQKGDLGMFQVLRIEYYTLTGTIEIWV